MGTMLSKDVIEKLEQLADSQLDMHGQAYYLDVWEKPCQKCNKAMACMADRIFQNGIPTHSFELCYDKLCREENFVLHYSTGRHGFSLYNRFTRLCGKCIASMALKNSSMFY